MRQCLLPRSFGGLKPLGLIEQTKNRHQLSDAVAIKHDLTRKSARPGQRWWTSNLPWAFYSLQQSLPATRVLRLV